MSKTNLVYFFYIIIGIPQIGSAKRDISFHGGMACFF